jgi:hypothetical protein
MQRMLLAACILLAAQAQAAMPDWRTVPGEERLELALDSVDMQGSRVAALLRAPAGAVRLAGDMRPKRAARVVLLADFDCASRTVQMLSVIAYDRSDRPLSSTGAPGAAAVLDRNDPLLAAYDALCELARDRR